MAGIRGKNTNPEVILRKALHGRGFRYRLNVKGMPGKPDMVFPGRRAVLFAHGCFWHRHDCHLFKWPSSRKQFWQEKLNANAERDLRNIEALKGADWRVGIVWECAIRGKHRQPFEDVIDACADWLAGDANWLEVRGD